MPDFLDEKRSEIQARLSELAPLLEEYDRLKAAAAVLDGIGSADGASLTASTVTAATVVEPKRRGRRPGRKKAGRPPARKVGRPRGSGAKKVGRPPRKATTAPAATNTGTPRRGRQKGSGVRSAQALQLVSAQPGITIPELATKMDIKQNYLYRVLPALEQEGKIKKQGRGWHPSTS